MNHKDRKPDIQKDFCIPILKYSLKLTKFDILLSLIVFFYLVFSNSISELNLKNLSLLSLIQIFLLFGENYITIAVYSGIKKTIWKENFKFADIFKEGLHFFFRILTFKVFIGLSIGILAGISLGIIDIVKKTPPVLTAIIFSLTLLWLSIPVYFLLLTFFSPVIIIFKDVELFTSIKMSYYFLKRNLKEVFVLSLSVGIFWAFVVFILKLYNNSNFLKYLFFYFLSLLEIFTIKIFMFLYYKREEKNERYI